MQADPGAKLYYNDFNLEYNGNKTNGALQIVRMLQNAGMRIDGVGFQAHMNVGGTPSRQQIAAVLQRFTSLGLEVALTELDIAQKRLPPNATAVAQQARDYVSMVGGCLDTPKCVGVVVWEFTDKYSWIPGVQPGEGAACLYDENLQKKPAYTSVSSLLAAAATRAAAVNGNNNAASVAMATATAAAASGGDPASAQATTNPVAVAGADSSAVARVLLVGLLSVSSVFLWL